MLAGGFSGDDKDFALMRLREEGSVWSLANGMNSDWMREYGRLFPLSGYETVIVMTTFSSRFAYKVFQLAAVGLSIGSIALLAATITRTRVVALVTAVCAIALLQVRVAYDPIVEGVAQQEILVVLIATGLVLGVHAVRKGSPWLYPAVGILTTAALLTYETAFFVLPAYLLLPILAEPHARRHALRWLAIAVFAPALVLGAATLVLRANSEIETSSAVDSYTADLTPKRAVPALAHQLSATLPLSYATLADHEPVERVGHAWDVDGGDIVVAVLCMLPFLWVATHRTVIDRNALLVMAGIGAVLWLGPSITTAVTKGRQSAVSWGVGYVSVFIGYMGVGLLLAALVFSMSQLRRAPRVVGTVTSLLVGLLLTFSIQINADNNPRAISTRDVWRNSRELFERSTARGVFSGAENGSRLVTTVENPWVHPRVIEHYAGTDIAAVLDSQALAGLDRSASLYLETTFDHAEGMNAVAPVASFDPTTNALSAEGAWLYVEAPELDTDQLGVRATSAAGAKQTFGPEQVRVVASGDEWALLELSSAHEFDPRTLTVDPHGGPQLYFVVP